MERSILDHQDEARLVRDEHPGRIAAGHGHVNGAVRPVATAVRLTRR